MATDAGFTECRHDIDTEEGHPADQEDAHYDSYRNGGLVVGHVIRRRVHLLELQFRLVRLWPTDASIVLLLGYFPGTGHRTDRLNVLLSVAV